MNTPNPFLGLLEPDAEKLAQQLHGLAKTGVKVSDAARATPMLMSLAISAKRIADTLEAITDDPAQLQQTITEMAWRAGQAFEQGRRT